MATGGFKSSATTDFLEEWKAKREKMRAKMLGDIAAATGANSAGRQPGPELGNSGNPERSASSGNCLSSSYSTRGGRAPPCAPQRSRSRSRPGEQPEEGPPPSDKESPSPSKGKEKKSAGPSARKGKGQIEKRKLREKRRSTGVVSIPSNESLDELDDDDAVGKDRREEEEELVQANTFQNEAMTADPTTGYLMVRRDLTGGGSRDGFKPIIQTVCFQELARERQENSILLKAHQDKDDLIGKLKEEIDLLNRDLDDIEDENEQLKQENKTLLKVVGQLTR
uniref:Uncharacterized protein n=1 Tax=Anabas testudineus TaxID=64144 RepID=A0A3Q1JS52_ANATE